MDALLAARRGSANVAPALRLVAPYLLLGMALIGAVAATAVYLRPELRRIVVELAPQRPRASGWIEREKQLFSRVLAGQTCDVLVGPIDVGAGAADSLDRPARSLIERYLAAQVQAQSGLCVIDSTLAARALGPTARSHSVAHTLALAASAGARWVVLGDTALSDDRRTFEVTIQTYTRQPGEKVHWGAADGVAWGPVAFSDDLPPEEAFALIAAQVVAQLGLPDQRPGPAVADAASAAGLPPSPIELASDTGSPTGRAERLQLLAATYPSGEVNGEHLWERSLVALSGPAGATESARVMRARAALHLHRRPYTLALLRGIDSAEARAVRALAQGDLPQAQQLASQIADGMARLITQLEIESLRTTYGRTTGQLERRRAVLAAAPAYTTLLEIPLSSGELVSAEPQRRVAGDLLALGATVKDDPQDLMRRGSRMLMLDPVPLEDVATQAAAIERGYVPLWRARGDTWRLQPALDRVAEWDVYDALFSANRLVVSRAAQGLYAKQNPDALLALNRALTPLFGGYPPLETQVANALLSSLTQPSGEVDLLLTQRASRLSRDIATWEGGQTEATRSLALAQPQVPLVPEDEPPRPWAQMTGAKSASPQASATEQRGQAVQLVRMLAYAQSDFTVLERSYAALRRAGLEADAERVIALNQERFIGHPGRDRFLMRLADERGDLATQMSLLQQQTQEQLRDWRPRLLLAKVQLRAGQFQQAQQTLLAYPLFSTSATDPRLASQPAAEAGELLLYAGEPNLARPLFQIAASDAGGSPSALWSAVRLAQIGGRWREARDQAEQMHERTQSPGALAAAAEISFLMGESEAGWRAFYAAAKRFETIDPWRAASTAHRIAQTPNVDLVAFAKHWNSLSGVPEREAHIKASFLFNMLMVDRPADPNTLQMFSSFAGRVADKRYDQLGAGYHAFKRGDFATAVDRFGELTPSTGRSDTPYALPYLAASLARAGRGPEAQPLIQMADNTGSRTFHQLLARAYAQGFAGQVDAAVRSLWQSQLELSALEPTSVPPAFELLEACEKLTKPPGTIAIANC